MANPLEGDLEIPKVGKLPKKVVVPLAVGLAGFVAWRFWSARGGASTGDEASTIADGEFGAIDTGVPDTLNPFPGSFGGGGGTPTGNTDTVTGDRDGDGIIGPGEFTNNGQWTKYVTGELTGGNWTYDEIVTAIGNGLAGRPTSSTQQDIIRAALAVGGQPPSGSLTVVSGGNTGLTVAPAGISASAAGSDAVTVSFSAVAGASSYVAYVNGQASPSGAGGGSPIRISNLKPSTTYTVSVAGLNSAGTPGPKSSTVTVKTAAAAAAGAVTGLSATKTDRDSTFISFKGATGAVKYRVFVNGKLSREVPGPPFTLAPLNPNTSYKIGVAAVNTSGAQGATATVNVKTKK